MSPDESFWFAGIVMTGVVAIIIYLVGMDQ